MSEVDELRSHIRTLEDAADRHAELVEKLDFIEAHLLELSERYGELAEKVDSLTDDFAELAEPMRAMQSVQAMFHQVARPQRDPDHHE